MISITMVICKIFKQSFPFSFFIILRLKERLNWNAYFCPIVNTSYFIFLFQMFKERVFTPFQCWISFVGAFYHFGGLRYAEKCGRYCFLFFRQPSIVIFRKGLLELYSNDLSEVNNGTKNSVKTDLSNYTYTFNLYALKFWNRIWNFPH